MEGPYLRFDDQFKYILLTSESCATTLTGHIKIFFCAPEIQGFKSCSAKNSTAKQRCKHLSLTVVRWHIRAILPIFPTKSSAHSNVQNAGFTFSVRTVRAKCCMWWCFGARSHIHRPGCLPCTARLVRFRYAYVRKCVITLSCIPCASLSESSVATKFHQTW